MIPLPEEAALSLLRGVGAYLRATPAPELPPEVRRFRGFRDAAMATHRDTILALLDDAAARRMILEWLDEDKPSLRKRDAANLRIACERLQGWEKRLSAERRAATAGSAAAAAPAQQEAAERRRLETALERSKEKARRWRQDLKREREQGAELLAAERARAAAAAEEVEVLRAALVEARRQAEAARGEADASERRADREVRRARRAAEEAALEAARLRAELKDTRPRAAGGEASRPEVPKRRPSVRKPRTGPREPLKVRRGLLAEAPATLDHWLDRDDVYLLVDGYNVTKAQTGYGDVELEAQRERLIREVGSLAARKQIQGTIVFDGSDVPVSGRPKRRGPVKVVFSREDEIADDRIIGLLAELPPIPVVLATNDRELQERGRVQGATIATSDQLLALLR